MAWSAKQVRVRIGLNSGVAIVGNMDAATRFNYSMMGDNVNLAARLESGAKSYGACGLFAARPRKSPLNVRGQERFCFVRSAE